MRRDLRLNLNEQLKHSLVYPAVVHATEFELKCVEKVLLLGLSKRIIEQCSLMEVFLEFRRTKTFFDSRDLLRIGHKGILGELRCESGTAEAVREVVHSAL